MREQLSFLLVLFIGMLCPGTAWADETPASVGVVQGVTLTEPTRKEVFEIDQRICLECIRLIRFNINFHEKANRYGFWRDWIYPLAQESGTALNLSNTLTDLTQRARGIKDPSVISKTAQRKGLDCALTGQIINGTSSGIELLHNGGVALVARHEGFSPRRSVAFVKASVATIDDLLARRDALLNLVADSEEKHILVLQGKLLAHIKHQAVFQFQGWSSYSREAEWAENTFYSIDAIQNYTQVSSTIVSLQGLTNSKLSGPSAITVLAANSAAMLNPIIRSAVGRCMAEYQTWYLSKVFPGPKPRVMQQLLHDWSDLDEFSSTKAANDSNNLAIKDLAFLARHSQNFDRALIREEKNINHYRRVAEQQAISGPLIGMATTARSISATVAYYGYHTDSYRSNQINFAGRISQASGQSYSLMATPIAKWKHFTYTRKLAREGKLPAQILKEHLKKLDVVEGKIIAAQP